MLAPWDREIQNLVGAGHRLFTCPHVLRQLRHLNYVDLEINALTAGPRGSSAYLVGPLAPHEIPRQVETPLGAVAFVPYYY